MAASGSPFLIPEVLESDASKAIFADFEEVLWLLEGRSIEDCSSLTDVELSHCQKIADLSAANSLTGSEYVKNVWVPVFEKLATLRPEILKIILEKFKSHKLSFVKVGNVLASNNHQWLLGTFWNKIQKSTTSNSEIFHAQKNLQKRADELKGNVLAILNYLVESLKFESSSLCNSESHLAREDINCFPNFLYLSTLLKVSCELDADASKGFLMKHMSKNLPKLLLGDIQILEWKIIQTLFIEYSIIIDETGKNMDVTSVASLADNYIYWKILHDVRLEFNDFFSFVELFSKEARRNCDKLYDAIDLFLKKNPDIAEIDRLHLCEFLDPFKLSEAKVEDAVHNQDIILHPSFFTALYSSQKQQIANIRSTQDKVAFIVMILFSLLVILSLYVIFWMPFVHTSKPTSLSSEDIVYKVMNSLPQEACPSLDDRVSGIMKETKFPSIDDIVSEVTKKMKCPSVEEIVSEVMKRTKSRSVDDIVSKVMKKTKCLSVEEIVSKVLKSLPPPPSLQSLLGDAADSTKKSVKSKLAETFRHFGEKLRD